MIEDRELMAQRMAEWSRGIAQLDLPDWDKLPQLELYMDQVIILLTQYLAPLTRGEDEKAITASTINNYVRMKVMPPPVKKKYGRVHIAYLLIILTLKLSLSISQIAQLLPRELTEAQVRALYADFCTRFARTQQHFVQKLQQTARELACAGDTEAAVGSMVMEHALSGAFHTLLALKLLALDGAEAPQSED